MTVIVGTGVAPEGMYVVVAVSGVYPARPSGVSAGHVQYVGPTQPTDWMTNDLWLKTS